MSRFSIPGLPLFMPGKAPAKEIGRVIEKLDIKPSGNLEDAPEENACVAAIQLLIKKYDSPADYIIDMNLYIEDAVNRRAQIVVFPAYTGLLPFSLVPKSAEIISKLRGENDSLPSPDKLNEALSYCSDFMFDMYYNVMSALAARHQVYVMAGTTLYFDGDELRHRAFLFDYNGELTGFQDKLSLSKLERELAIEEAYEVKVFDTIVAPVSIISCGDAEYYEISRAAARLGAKILLHPTYYTHEYTPVDSAGGLNLRVQENHVYGVQSVMTGDTGIGLTFEGPGCIFAPNDLVKSKNGLLEQTSGRFTPDILCKRLELDKLAENPNPYTKDINPDLMEKYVDRLY